MGIIPDKFILLNVDDKTTLDRVKQHLAGKEQDGYSNTSLENYTEEDMAAIARNALNEYTVYDIK